jgi:hypothetical protein
MGQYWRFLLLESDAISGYSLRHLHRSSIIDYCLRLRRKADRGNDETVGRVENEGLFSTLPTVSWKTPVLPASPTFPPPSMACIVYVSSLREQRSLSGAICLRSGDVLCEWLRALRCWNRLNLLLLRRRNWVTTPKEKKRTFRFVAKTYRL